MKDPTRRKNSSTATNVSRVLALLKSFRNIIKPIHVNFFCRTNVNLGQVEKTTMEFAPLSTHVSAYTSKQLADAKKGKIEEKMTYGR